VRGVYRRTGQPMSQQAPEVRAMHVQTLVAALDALGAERAAHVRGALAPSSTRRVTTAPRLDWIPAELLVELCEAVRDAGGDRDLERWGAGALDRVLRLPLARGFYEAALALAGRHPGNIVAGLTHAWPLLYRGCGELIATHREARLVRVVHADVPVLLRSAATVLPLVGGLGAIPGHCGLEGGASGEWTPQSPCCVYTVRWSDAAR
jgi:hypothetical protein